MVWLGLKFNTFTMTVTLPPVTLNEIMSLVHMWLGKEIASIQDLRSLLGKRIYMAQCCHPDTLSLVEYLTLSGLVQLKASRSWQWN